VKRRARLARGWAGESLIGSRHCGSFEGENGTNWSRADIKRHQKRTDRDQEGTRDPPDE